MVAHCLMRQTLKRKEQLVAHEVETAWMGGNVEAWWDRQREFVQAELMEPEEAWIKGGINWGVDLIPVEFNGEETDYSLVVRDKDDKVLSCVGPQYTPLQNWTLMEYLMAVTNAGYGLKIESAMSLKGGKVVAICARRPEAVKIADDEHLQYFTGANWHDGTRKAVLYASNVRTVCANTLAFGLSSAPNVFSFRHTGDLESKIAEAKQVLGLGFEYQDQVVKIGNDLVNNKMSVKGLDSFLQKLYPVKSDDEQQIITRTMNTRQGVKQVYMESPDLQNIKGTAWGALQAVAAYNDHEINYRTPDNRFVASLTRDNSNQRAFDILRKEFQVA